MVFSLEKPPTERQLGAIRRRFFQNNGVPVTINSATLRSILLILGDESTQADVLNYLPAGAQMSFAQFTALLDVLFEIRIEHYHITTGNDGKAVLSRDYLLHTRDHLGMNSMQSQKYSKWCESVFTWVSHYFDVEWPPLPPKPAINRTKITRGTAYRGLEVRHLNTDAQFAVNVMALQNLNELRGMVEHYFGVHTGTYTMQYTKPGNVATRLDTQNDFITLKNTIDGVVLVEVE
ncbi:hypothetical protein CTI12_AA246800 [Artemisia annua]|uniref:Uncharacterized protein n=1 Tax=Artemisia annua TaxID=35608 RepID=A0A2U1NNY1_ARTAN|nr:hypothetical protein CTI12_AA246800 [Artemisia annua]